jgi:hypothetical protein
VCRQNSSALEDALRNVFQGSSSFLVCFSRYCQLSLAACEPHETET